jgi:large subunit ribosomal protein L7/L12
MIRHHVRSFGSNKILAIKAVRELTHCGLKEAKDLVEQHGSFMIVADAQTQARVAREIQPFGIEFDPPLGGTTFTSSTGPTGATGFAPGGGYSLRYRSGPQKIAAIKLVRELTGLGLKEAKDLVEEGGVVRSDLTQAEAEDYARRFAEIDSHVEVLAGVALPKPQPRYTHDFEKEDDYDF